MEELVPTPKITKIDNYIPNYFNQYENIKEFTMANFTNKGRLKDKKCYFIMFYRPDCVYCKELKKIWPALADIVVSCNIGAFNCEKSETNPIYKKYLDKYIDGYPTCIIFSNGQIKKVYEEENNIDKLLSFIMKI